MHDNNSATSPEVEPRFFMSIEADLTFRLFEVTDDPRENELAIAEIIDGGLKRITLEGIDAYINELHHLDPHLECNRFATRIYQAVTGTTEQLQGPVLFVGVREGNLDSGLSADLVRLLIKSLAVQCSEDDAAARSTRHVARRSVVKRSLTGTPRNRNRNRTKEN